MVEEIKLDSWKGKDCVGIWEAQNGDCVVVEHRQDKESGDVTEIEHIVPKYDIQFLWALIDQNCELGIVYGYRFLVKKLIEAKSWEIDIEAFNGGKNRASFYFPYYYWPLKVLEYKGLVRYLGRGGVMKQ